MRYPKNPKHNNIDQNFLSLKAECAGKCDRREIWEEREASDRNGTSLTFDLNPAVGVGKGGDEGGNLTKTQLIPSS